MVSIIQKISVEVSKPNFFQAIVAKQYDSNSRFLKATLIQDNEKISVASTSTVTINAKRNDGTEKSFAGEVNDDGTVTVPLTYWMLELDGTLECDISIFGADESKLTSTRFIVEVERASCQGDDVTDADKCDILILQGQNIVGSVNGKTGVVELNAADVGAVSLTEFEENKAAILKTLGDLATDYIVEQGVSDNWTYRKWDSGIAECWTNKTIREPFDENNPTIALCGIDLPFSLTEPTVTCSGKQNGTWGSYVSMVDCNGTTVSAYMMCQSNVSECSCKFNFQVMGRWK